MHFFEAKADEQNRILMEALPHAEIFFDIYDDMKSKKLDSKEHKAASEARVAMMTAEALYANDKENKKKQEAAVKARATAIEAISAADRVAERSGRNILRSVLFGGNISEYAKNAYTIVALFRNETVEEMISSKGMLEILGDLTSILESEQVVNFFDAVRKLNSIEF